MSAAIDVADTIPVLDLRGYIAGEPGAQRKRRRESRIERVALVVIDRVIGEIGWTAGIVARRAERDAV